MLKMMIDAGAPPRAAIFANTSMETPDTLKFVFAVEKNILKPAGVPFHIIELCRNAEGRRRVKEVSRRTMRRAGDLMLNFVRGARFMPSRRNRMCTNHLKVETHGRFIFDKYGLRDPITAVGFRADEGARVTKMRARNAALEEIAAAKKLFPIGDHWKIAPLYEWGVDRDMVMNEIADWGKWADVAKGDAHLSNCVGCFYNRSIASKLRAFKDYPALAGKWVEAEKWLQKYKDADGVNKRRVFPILLDRTHKKLFNGKPLPPHLHSVFTCDENYSWQQMEMLHKHKREGFTLPFPDYPDAGGGCGDGFCGTD